MKFFNRTIHKIIPPPKWRVPVLVLSGIIAGLFCWLFYVSRAYSYLSDEPSTCVNCHIMATQYATWQHSSHREVAGCNDCHVPQDNFFSHYYFKAKDGLRHATIFTLRTEPQTIYIHEAGKEVVQQNCIRCHGPLLTDARMNARSTDMDIFRKGQHCLRCHREVPHGRVNSLSAVPWASGIPLPKSPVPDWLNDLMKKEQKDK